MSVSTIMGVPIANIAKINGIPIASISKWNGEVIDQGSPFITEWVIPSDSLSVTLPLRYGNGATFNCTVDWGDSTNSTITAHDDVNRIHTYESAGTYKIKITGTCEGWNFGYSDDKLKITKVVNFGSGSSFAGFKYLQSGFFGCTNLTSLGTAPIKPSGNGVNIFTSCFSGCTSLTTIPADLFRYNISATNFDTCFNGCTSLTTIPVDLFRYNISSVSFGYTFNNCNKLQLRSDIFYASGEQTTRFLNTRAAFTGCFLRTLYTGSHGTAPDLWNCNFGTGTPIKTSCFGGAGNSSTSLSNYADIPADWK